MFKNNNFEIDSRISSSMSFRNYVLKTFTTMALGLLITAVSAVVFMSTGLGFRLMMIPFAPIILFVAQMGVVMSFSARLFKASAGSAKSMFFIYSVLTGITFSLLGYMYAGTDIALAFGITCVYFGSLVAIGYTTKIDLTRFGPILMTGLVILIIFNFIAMIFNMQGMEMILCSLGLLIFTGLTAYDAQKMRKLYVQYEGNDDMLQRLSIHSALQLYLDFINIFLYMLRFIGNRD